MPSRSRVVLEWGATLYSGETFERSVQESDKVSADPSTSFLGKDQPWQQLSTSIMTSMVVSLDFIELSRELLVARNYHWDLNNYATLLSALETMHWHAFCFNENSHLRLQLQQRGFMKKSQRIHRTAALAGAGGPINGATSVHRVPPVLP